MSRRVAPHLLLWREAWRAQRGHARTRGIPFYFGFEEWVLWWTVRLGPDWFDYRGRKHGQFVMARFGDEGPYHPDNVKCITAVRNSKQRTNPAGEANPGSKLTEIQVREILASAESRKVLAVRFKCTPELIWAIRAGRAWKHIPRT